MYHRSASASFLSGVYAGDYAVLWLWFGFAIQLHAVFFQMTFNLLKDFLCLRFVAAGGPGFEFEDCAFGKLKQFFLQRLKRLDFIMREDDPGNVVEGININVDEVIPA